MKKNKCEKLKKNKIYKKLSEGFLTLLRKKLKKNPGSLGWFGTTGSFTLKVRSLNFGS
jgi:hypothetical protein